MKRWIYGLESTKLLFPQVNNLDYWNIGFGGVVYMIKQTRLKPSVKLTV